MQQNNKTIPSKYCKQLKPQDFVVLTQENKQFRALIKIMNQKQAVLVSKIDELQGKFQRLENQKEEYRIRCGQYLSKIAQYDLLKQQIAQDYVLLKKEIQLKVMKKDQSEEQICILNQKVDALQQQNAQLEQNSRRKGIIIEELTCELKKMQKKLLQNKITVFHNLIQNDEMKINTIRKPTKTKKKPQLSYLQSKTQSNTRSLNSSNLNSISFSLVQSDNISRSRASCSAHNKSIYI